MFVSHAAKACTARLNSQSCKSAHFCRNLRDCAILPSELTLAAPFSLGGRMARRSFQMPNVLRQEGPRPYWYIRYRINVLVGTNQVDRDEQWHPLGYCDEMTEREAEGLRDEIMREVNAQVYTIPSRVPVKDFIEIYKRDHFPTLTDGTQDKYSSLLSNHILPAFEKKRLCDLDTHTIQVFLNQERKGERGLGYWTLCDLRNLLFNVYRKATQWGYWLGPNPVSGTCLPRKRWKRLRRILTDDQFRRLLELLPPTLQLIIMTVVSTSMRASEILGLKWRSVNLENGLITVDERYYRGNTDVPKSECSEWILPLGKLLPYYRRYKPSGVNPDSYVFHADGHPFDDRTLLKKFLRPAAKRLGVHFTGFGWHSFRRQNITRIQDEGAEMFEAQAQAGHSRPNQTRDYTIITLKRRKRVVLRFQKRLLEKGKEWTPERGIAGILREG